MSRRILFFLSLLLATAFSRAAWAVQSAELYTTAPHGYGRFEARIQFPGGNGVVGAFFLWKDGSELAGTFWNELDFEKIGAGCDLVTNAYYGNPAVIHNQSHPLEQDFCGAFHTYAYEWTPDAIAWFVDGVEIRRETGATATAYADNASGGMQIRFNLWPGDATFGGAFDPSILPVHQYLDWVEFSSYADGAFTLEWREDFDGETLSPRWSTGNWGSPKNLSTHQPANVNLIDGYAVMSLTADDAIGPAGAMVPGGGKASGSGEKDSEGCSLGAARSQRSSAFFTAFGLVAIALFRRALRR